MFQIFSLDAPISEKSDSQEAAVALADKLAQENPGARIDVFQEPNLHVYHVVWDGDFKRKNFMRHAITGDEVTAHELVLWANNSADVYRHLQSIYQNLTRKMAQSKYDSELAVKAFMHVVETAAKDYVREHGSPGEQWFVLFPKNIRLMAAKELRDEFEAEVEVAPEYFEEYVYKKDLPSWQEKYRGRESKKQCGCPATQSKRGEIMTRSKNRRQRLADRVREARKNAEQKRRLAREDAREDDQEEKLQRKAQSLRKMLRKAERELMQLRREKRPTQSDREERSAEVRERIARIRAEREKDAAREERIAAARERIRRKRQIREKIAERKAEREKQPEKKPEKREAEAPKYFRRKKDGKIYVRVD